MAAETKRECVEARIRAFRPADAAAVTSILRDAPEAANWPEEGYREALNWPGVVALVGEKDGNVTGFILGRRVAEVAEILNLAVTPASRRRGEGEALLRAALAEFRSCGVSRVFLEVRESNEIGIAFYEKHGFSKTGRRAGYYRDPDEAALVMQGKVATEIV
jgi:[ribosomal protein S18]-alanine N-acetyltransferase